MDILACAVDAALGPGIDVERAGRGASLDATIRQVEAGLAHVEEDEVVVALLGHQHRRHHAVFAARQAGIEDRMALGVGGRRAEDLVILGKQRQFGVADRLGGAQRAGKDVQPILARVGGQADVGDDEPLCGARIVVVALVVWMFILQWLAYQAMLQCSRKRMIALVFGLPVLFKLSLLCGLIFMLAILF